MDISIRELIELAEQTPYLPEKEYILRRCDQDILGMILEDVGDETRDYDGLTSDTLLKMYGQPYDGSYTIDHDYGVFHTVLRDLAGTSGEQKQFYKYVLWQCIGTFKKKEHGMLMRILDRNIKIRYAGI